MLPAAALSMLCPCGAVRNVHGLGFVDPSRKTSREECRLIVDSAAPPFDRCRSTVDRSRIKVLNVGAELTWEVLPLCSGQCLYELHGLKALKWYEVKISCPASIPASFSIKLIKYNSSKLITLARRLLNTEKLIFEADSNLLETSGYSGIFAFVSVMPVGVVAKSYLKEQHSVVYNIVCDELLNGIPYQAWWVGFLVVFGLLISCLIPNFLRPELLSRKGRSKSMKQVS